MIDKVYILDKNTNVYILSLIFYDKKIKNIILKQLKKNKKINICEVKYEEV